MNQLQSPLSVTTINELRYALTQEGSAAIYDAYRNMLPQWEDNEERILLIGWSLAGENSAPTEPGDQFVADLLRIYQRRAVEREDIEQAFQRFLQAAREQVQATGKESKVRQDLQRLRGLDKKENPGAWVVEVNHMLIHHTSRDIPLLLALWFLQREDAWSSTPGENFLHHLLQWSLFDSLGEGAIIKAFREFEIDFECQVVEVQKFVQEYAGHFQQLFQRMIQRGEISAPALA